MKEGPVKFSPARPKPGAGRAHPVSGLAAVLTLAAFLLPVLLACVTPVPRHNTPAPSALPPPSPALAVTVEPAPSPPPEPTATLPPTAAPTPEPSATPEPTRPPVGPLRTPPATEAPEGLILQVYAPEDGATVPGSAVTVYGQTTPGARVFISGVETIVDAQGGFRAEAPLDPDENMVEVVATNVAGDRKQVARQVTSLALPFLLLITEPEHQSVVSSPSVRLSGRTGPNAIVSINGASELVDQFGYFSATVRLDEGPNVIDVVATNDDGETHSTVLVVIYRLVNE